MDMEKTVPVQTPAYIELDLQSQCDGDVRNSAQFSVESEEPSLSAMINQNNTKKSFSPLYGPARKAALPMIAFSAVGWILFALSFGIYRNRYMYAGTITDYPELYWAWTASVIGPVAYVLALIHAVMWKKAGAVIGSATALLGMIYTTTMGYGLVTCATYTYEVIKYADDDDISSVHDDYPEYIGLMFTGSFIACLFWGLTLALWPWYADVRNTTHSFSNISYCKDTHNV